MIKQMTLAVFAALVAGQAFAMPSKAELDKVSPVVQELMKPIHDEMRSGKKTRSEVADAAMELVAQAKSEAAKFLLIKGAYGLYVRDGNFDAAVKSLQTLQTAVADVPAQNLANIIESSLRTVPKKNGGQLYRLLDETKTIAKYQDGLKRLNSEVKRDPKNKALQTSLAEHHAVLGNWTEALKAFVLGDNKKAAEAAKAEQGGAKNKKAIADFWWNYPSGRPDLQKSFQWHAAELYSAALAANEVVGLYKAQVEKRIAEVGPLSPVGLVTPVSASANAEGLYCVIDLSAGPNAKKYPVSYLNDIPKGGWTDEYKMNKLVLRKIKAGKEPLGRYVIEKDFYIGVFEVTQKQWQLVQGNNPSEFVGEKHPVEMVSYGLIRGLSVGDAWLQTIDDDTFIGNMRNRTGLSFELPTEKQWEYACRAGTTSLYNNGGNEIADLKILGKFEENGGRTDHHSEVGSFIPNQWGLYDMHGNVRECCLDWGSDTHHISRGGNFYNHYNECTSSFRGHFMAHIGFRNHVGFRLVIQPPIEPSKASAEVGGVQLWENGPYWAECNVGASKPEESGYYFWWGDTVGYKRVGDCWNAADGSRTGFSFNDKNCPTYGKDKAQLQAAGYIDATGNLTSTHDAATAHLGAPWRMPTDADFAALIKNCDTEWTTRNGVAGRLVKGRGAYVGKSIFWPAAGFSRDTDLSYASSSGYYWASAPRLDGLYSAWGLGFHSSRFDRLDYNRFRGQSVRPVRDPAR